MPVAFDVFTKRTKLFYILGGITIVTLPALAVCDIFNVQFKTHFTPLADVLIDALIIVTSLTSASFLFAVASGLGRTYVKDGELILADDYLIIDETKIPLNEAKSIRLKVAIWNRKHFGNLLRNRIEIADKNNKTYKNRFVIKSYDHSRDFEKVMAKWQANGVAFDWKYNTF
jgi:hypothetical protein